MKHLYHFCLAIVFGCGLSSCMSTVSLRVLDPADVTLPEHIKKVVVVNRTYPERDSEVMNVIEGIVTGEGIGTDRRATEECVSAMVQTMKQSPRFELVRPSSTMLKGTGTGAFPESLDWNRVNEICTQSGADALITLEAFDSDSRVLFRDRMVEERLKDGKVIQRPVVDADMRMVVTNGWRIYDNIGKVIVDEHRADDFLVFNASAPNQQLSLAALPLKMDALVRTAVHAGQRYGFRISPMWINVARTYYKKGNGGIEKGSRLARIGKWEEASEHWRKQTNAPSAKSAGRACYNMAVFCEVSGRPDLAIEWANKAYTAHGNRKARAYSAILEARMRKDAQAAEQMAPVFNEQ